MSTRCTYELDTGFPAGGWFTSPKMEHVDEELHDLLGRSDSSGSGMGTRDHQWQFATRREAEAAEEQVRRVFLAHGFDFDHDAPTSKHCYTGVTHQHWDESWSSEYLDSLTEEQYEALLQPEDDCPTPVEVGNVQDRSDERKE
jgi:hypothetical protein